MNDLHYLLRDACRHGNGLSAADPALVDADVARGRRALAMRRLRNGGMRVAVVAVVTVGAALVVNQPRTPLPERPASRRPVCDPATGQV